MSNATSVYLQLCKVKVGGSTLLDSVIDVRVEKAMSATATCDITIAASRTGNDTASAMLPSGVQIGTDIEVTGGNSDSSLAVVFKGIVISVTWEIDAEVGEFVVVRAVDKGFKLWHSSPRRALLQQSYSDVISTIAGDVGLQADVSGAAFSVVQEYQLQTTSSGEMLRTIMAATGGFWAVEDAKLVVREADAAALATVGVAYGADLLRLKARVSGVGGESKVQVRSWNPAATSAIVATDSSSDMFPGEASSKISSLLDSTDRIAGSAGVVSSHHIAADSTSASNVAKALRRRVRTGQLQVRMERGSATDLDKIRPGAVVNVTKAGAELNGAYRVASVVHVFNMYGWRSIITTGTLEPPTLPEMSTDASRVPSWSRQGLVIGIVSNNAPEDAAHAGMVKVKFQTIDDQVESAWARVVSTAGGPKKGILAIPEVDDEVVVAFEQGDPARPLVLGGVWSETNAVPVAHNQYIDQGTVKVWTITSRTGQRITVTDGGDDANQHIEIAMPGDKIKLHVGNDKVELWADTKTLEVKAGDASMLLDDQGKMTLKAKNIAIKADQDVTIDGTNITIKASANLKAEGSAGAEIKAGATGKFEASGPLALKGAVVNIN